MSMTHTIRSAGEGDTRIELHRRHYDGVETDHRTLVTWDLDEAKALHAQLGEAIGQAEVNHVAKQRKRRGELQAKRRQLEADIERIDRELAVGA